jgi:hypothetical protein
MACVFALAALALPAGADAATVPEGMFGMNDWTPPTEQAMVATGDEGVRTWRAAMFWYLIEREQGVRDWSEYDELVSAAARRDTSLLMVIASCPDWACPDLSGPPRGDALAAHHAFVRDAVGRYGTGGSFWQAHPELPYRPVTDWQVWNEVNATEFWKPGPDAAGYAQFLQAEAAVIRSADPEATVVLSGLTDYGQVRAADFLDQLYAQPGFTDSFDVLALHAYAHDAPAVGRLLDRFRAVSERHGDGARRLWITEIGWATTGPGAPITVTPQDQAERLRSSFDMVLSCRDRWALDRAYWFAYRDMRPPEGQPDVPGYHTGLLDTEGRPKPAWAALGEYGEGATVGDAPCSTAAKTVRAPNTRVHGRRLTRAGRRARFRLRASVSGARFECRLHRVSRRGRRAVRGHGQWRPCRRSFRTPRLRRGAYVLRARAVDGAGRADPTPASRRVRVRRKPRAHRRGPRTRRA